MATTHELLACLLPHLEEGGREGRREGEKGERLKRQRAGEGEKVEGREGEREEEKRVGWDSDRVKMAVGNLTEESGCKAPQYHHVESDVPPLHVAEGGEEKRERGACRDNNEQVHCVHSTLAKRIRTDIIENVYQ